MLVDWHSFEFQASVPWPQSEGAQLDWAWGIHSIESWLQVNVGARLQSWAWSDAGKINNIGVAFRWERDQLLFVLTWSR
jgi:hypothetical protein